MNFKPNRISFSAKRTFPDTLWYVCLLALLIPVFLGHFPAETVLAAQPLVYASSLCAYALLAFKIFFRDEHTLAELAVMGFWLLCAALCTVFSGNRCFLSTFLLVFSAKGLNFEKLCRVFFWFFLSTLLLNLLLVAAGVLEDTVTIRWEVINHGKPRHSLGFGYANTLGFWTVLLIFSALLYFRKKHRIAAAVGALLFAVCVFLITDSKAALLASCAAALLCLAAILFGEKLSSRKWSIPLCLGLYLLGILVFLTLSLLYREDNGFFRLCNQLLSDRLTYSGAAFHSIGVHLFGAHVNFGWDPVDSLYAYAPICLGIVPSLCYLGLNLYALYRAARSGRWDIVAVFFAGALYSTMEYGLLNPVHLPLFAAFAELEGTSAEKSSL